MPIQLTAFRSASRLQGGILDQVLREVEIECLPGDIPSHIDVDVIEPGNFGMVLRVSDLPHSDKLKFLADEDAAGRARGVDQGRGSCRLRTPRLRLPRLLPSLKLRRRASRRLPEAQLLRPRAQKK